MTKRMLSYLSSLGEDETLTLKRDAQEALRLAWPHRETYRGGIVVRSNVDMLRNLRAL